MSSLPASLVRFRTDLETAIGLELARRRKSARRKRLLVVAAAGLLVVVSASAYATARDLFFGAHPSFVSGVPEWSPDGRRIAYLSTSCLPGRPPCTGQFKIVVESLDGRAQSALGQAALRTAVNRSPPVLSPDWRKLAFVRDRGLFRSYPGGVSLRYTSIVVTNVDGSRRRQLTPKGLYRDPVWSPDGTKLAFVRLSGDSADLYVVAADGTGRRKLARAISYPPNPHDPPKSPNPNPTWSPDGRKLAFTSNRDGNEDIYVANVDGSGLANLTRSRGNDRVPTWSPDGRSIAFRSDRDGNGEIYVMNADGSAQRRLTRDPESEGLPVWSPDGRKILVARFGHGSSDIWVMNRDGSKRRRLSVGSSPAWSPDGRLVAFLSNKPAKVYVMSSAGGEPAALGEFVDAWFAQGRISRSAGGVQFSLSVPKTAPRQWENQPMEPVPAPFKSRGFYLSRSLNEGQAAEVVIYWTAFPARGEVAACPTVVNPGRRGQSIDELADALARVPGTELVSSPTRVRVGNRPATYLELVVREDRGCDPGFFFTWHDDRSGAFWDKTRAGARVRAWIIDVDGKLVVLVAETLEHGYRTRGFNYHPPPPEQDLQKVGREIEQIVQSIRFD
jgi:Tol biopolymer transport system component